MNRTLLPRLFGERPERFGAALPSSPGESFRTERNVVSIVSGPAAGHGARGDAAPLRAVRLSRSGGNRQKGVSKIRKLAATEFRWMNRAPPA